MPAPGSCCPTPPCGSSRATGSGWSGATAPARPPRSRCWPARASRTPARSTAAARSATCRRTRVPATSTSPPPTGCCPRAAWTRILAEMKALEAQLADDAEDERTLRRYGALEDQFAGLGGYAAEAEAARICANLGLPDRVLGADARHALRRPAPPHRAGPDPVPRRGRDRRRHPAARRADQPPRRRLDHLAARLPVQPQGRPHRHLPRREPARRGRQQGLVPRRQPLHRRRLQRRLEDVPGSSARPTRSAGAASAPTPRRRPAR